MSLNTLYPNFISWRALAVSGAVILVIKYFVDQGSSPRAALAIYILVLFPLWIIGAIANTTLLIFLESRKRKINIFQTLLINSATGLLFLILLWGAAQTFYYIVS